MGSPNYVLNLNATQATSSKVWLAKNEETLDAENEEQAAKLK